MKMTASGNIRNGTFKQISYHVNRTFLNKNYGTLNDKNLEHIQPKFSYLNLSNDGSQRIINGQLVFYYDKKKERSNIKNLANKVNSKYSDYIQQHNNKKSVKHNKSRQIHNLFKEKLLKQLPDKQRNSDNQIYLDKYQRLYIQNCGNSEENLHNIKLIQKYQIKNHKHFSFNEANKLYRKSVSIALSFYAKQFHKFNPDLLITNYATNIDECSNKKLEDPDALHVHTAIIGLTQTKSGKPSFSVGRAICQQEHVKYNSATIKIHGKRVNNSLHKAMKKFRARNGKIFLKTYLQPTLKIVFPKVKQFKNINYYQTGQKVNGLSMNQERLRQSAKNLANYLEKRLNKKYKQKSYKNKINGAKRARTLRKYQAKRRYLVKRNQRIKQAHRRLKQEQRVSIQKWKKNVVEHEKLAIKIKSQHKIIKNNQIKIQKQKSKLDKIRKLIHLKEIELKNVANNLIKAFQKTIKQNNKANNYNIRAINKANSRLEKDKLKQANNNIFTRIRSTFSKFHSNYSVSASQSQFSNYANIYNSISSASSYSSALPLIKAARVSKSASLLKSNQAVKRSMARRSRYLTTTSPTISTPTYSPNQRGWER